MRACNSDNTYDLLKITEHTWAILQMAGRRPIKLWISDHPCTTMGVHDSAVVSVDDEFGTFHSPAVTQWTPSPASPHWVAEAWLGYEQ